MVRWDPALVVSAERERIWVEGACATFESPFRPVLYLLLEDAPGETATTTTY